MNRINKGEDWRTIFPGVSTLTIQPDGNGPGLSLKITRNKGEAVRLVQDGDADAAVVAVKRVNETDFYSLGLRDLAKKLGTNRTKLLWFIEREGIQSNTEFFKVITVGKVSQKRYSKPCYEMLRERLAEVDLDALWKGRKRRQRLCCCQAPCSPGRQGGYADAFYDLMGMPEVNTRFAASGTPLSVNAPTKASYIAQG